VEHRGVDEDKTPDDEFGKVELTEDIGQIH
jgi:hypothetical protein